MTQRLCQAPKGTSIPRSSCHVKHWGVCPSHPLFGLASMGTRNMYELLQRWKLKRAHMPFLASLRPVSAPEEQAAFFFIGDTVGRGDTILVVDLERIHIRLAALVNGAAACAPLQASVCQGRRRWSRWPSSGSLQYQPASLAVVGQHEVV